MLKEELGWEALLSEQASSLLIEIAAEADAVAGLEIAVVEPRDATAELEITGIGVAVIAVMNCDG